MKKYFLFLTVFISVTLPAWSQQVPILTQSQINPFLLNPAYAGTGDWASVFMHTRSMWTAMTDAPQQYFLTVDGALNNSKVGLGLMLHANVEPIIRNMGALLTYRYKIRLADHHFLSGGLSGGFVQNSLDFSKAVVANPEELADFRGDWSQFNFNVHIGLLYQFKYLDVGIAVKQLTNTPFTYENTTTEKSFIYRLMRHYELSIAYHWKMNDYFALKPLFVAQSVEGMPFNFMFNFAGSYLDRYWVGGGYKLQSAYSILVGLAISDRLTLGYNCDIPATGFRSHFGVTHEVAIGYRFTKQSKKIMPGESISRNNVNHLQGIAQQQSEEIDRLKQSNEDLKKQLNRQEELYNSRNTEQQQLLEIYARDRAFIDSLMRTYEINIDNLPNETFQQNYYVVVGAYYNIADAKIFQKILEREIGLETNIILSDNGKYYFVYSKIITSKEEAKTEFKRLMGMNIQQYIYGNLWIYGKE
jgi:type IX secretion system PorP/SprF family membrane protein